MFTTSLTPPTIEQATIDHYVAKGRRERSRAFTRMIRSLFSAPDAETPTLARTDCTA